MKRISCLLLALSLLLLGGCRGGNPDNSSSDTVSVPETVSSDVVPSETESEIASTPESQVDQSQPQASQPQPQPEAPALKVLSIGNSYSTDSHALLHKLAAQNGVNMQTLNLYIGSCSLEEHAVNVEDEAELYTMERNGVSTGEKISVQQAIALDKWDIITLQQKSIEAGHPDSYEPYMQELVTFLRANCPSAKIYFHETWAYESDYKWFPWDQKTQREMYDNIHATVAQKAGEYQLSVIPTGSVIQHLRENVAEFDYQNGGLSLNCDGTHLSKDYGRYAAAATWLRTLTGKPVTATAFEGMDEALLAKIVNAVNQVCAAQ